MYTQFNSMRFELQFFGEEEEEGRGRGVGEKKKKKIENRAREGRKRFIHIFLAENSGRIQKVRRHKFEHFSKKLLTTEPFSPLRQFAMV